MAKNVSVFAIVFLCIVAVFYIHFGFAVLIPTNFGWLLQWDWAFQFLGWHYYQHEPWTFPIGEIQNYHYPIGTNIGLTDSLPLLAVPFKLISSILPFYFQYFGIWFFLNYVLQAFFALLLFKDLKIKFSSLIILILFVVFCPLLTFKTMHPTLCAQWLIVGSLWVYFIKSNKHPRRGIHYQLLLLMLSSAIHIYLCMMVLALTIALLCKEYIFKKSINLKLFFIYLGFSFVSILSIWYLLGYFSISVDKGMGGFGWFSVNLNALINTHGFTKLGLHLPVKFGQQYEGFIYLGLGLIMLGVLTFIMQLRNIKSLIFTKSSFPLFAAVVLMAIFALGNKVTLNSHILFQFELGESINNLVATFRANARFFWPAYYVIIIAILYGIVHSIKNPTVLTFVLAAALTVQVADIYPLFSPWDIKQENYSPPIQKTTWDGLLKGKTKIIMYPPFKTNYKSQHDYEYFVYLASQKITPITAGYVGRGNKKLQANYFQLLKNNIRSGNIEQNALYITTAEYFDDFKSMIEDKNISIIKLDGYYAFASKPNNFPDKLELNPTHFKNRFETSEFYKKIKYFETIILNDADWTNTIKKKAKKQGIPFDEMLKLDAKYMARQELNQVLK